MSEIALAKINSFAPVAQQANVQPIEPIFVLTSSQLQEIITKATKSLNLKVEALEARIIQLEEDKAKIEALEKDLTTLSDNQLIQLRLIADLRKSQEPQRLQKDRGEKTNARISKLKETLKSRGQGLTLKEVGRLLGMKPNQVTALVTRLDKRSFEIFTRDGDARQKVIRLRSFT